MTQSESHIARRLALHVIMAHARSTRTLAIAIFAAFSLCASQIFATTKEELRSAIAESFTAADYEVASELLADYLQRWPNDPQMRYNQACALCHLGEREAAASALFQAVQAGFNDFGHMRDDPDLEPIRDTEMYRAILKAAERLASRRVEDALERWRRTYQDESYRFEVDHERRIAFATALDETAHAEMRDMLQEEADHLIRTLFGAPPEYYVLIAIPTPQDARQIFNGDEQIGGRYEHTEHRLIARNIGSSLRHEFVHALHYGHMERLGLTTAHPIWIQEGLAALYENYVIDKAGRIEFMPNDRDAIVRRRLRIGNLIRLPKLLSMSAEQFMREAGHTYPEARSVFTFLAERSLLTTWYATYVDSFERDPTGREAFETVFQMSLDDIETEWRAWIRNRTLPDTRIGVGDASLGIVSSPNSGNDGVTVEQLLPDSAARRAGLRRNDIIVAVNGTPTRSLTELQTIIATMNVGDLAEIRYRRNGIYHDVAVVLQPLRPFIR